MISEDDPYIPLKTHDDIPREWEFKIWRGFRHFQGKQSPELLEEFLRSKNTGAVPVPEKDLPVKLPEVEFYEPTGTGESPLANISDWVSVKCPKCGGEGKRETNTMPQWAGSSWYYLRFIDPKNSEALVDKEKEKYWSPVDMYVGGAEHATRHLIYARFWHKFLYDIGAVNYAEPFMKLHNVGLILAEDGRKMSKRWGNVVNPDTIVEEYGADTLRVYEMFMGPFEQATAWSTESIVGPRRFLEKVWKLGARTIEQRNNRTTEQSGKDLEILLHQTIKKVTEDIEAFKFNTAISALMIFFNALEKEEEISQEMFEGFLILLSPFTPHIAEELWHEIGNENSIYLAEWPKYDEAKTQSGTITIAVQVNGKMRATFDAPPDISETDAVARALEMPEVQKWTGEELPRKTIFVKGRLVSFVV
ncbi:MAG: class I tRNA ligase family protein [Parcubacteria group bacterium]|nr:class I tRNA ligase family protein [Parcubacteria group bacterium]